MTRRTWSAIVVWAMALLGSACSIGYGEDTEGQSLKAADAPADCGEATFVGSIAELREASGLAASRRNPNVLWTHNDSAAAVVFALSADGSLLGRVRLTGATVEDWEAVTVAACPQGSCLYIADIGDNEAIRAAITLYRTPEPAANDAATAPVQALRLSYPDGPHDAESLFAAPDGTLFIVTKGEGGPVNLYRMPRDAAADAPVRLERVVSLTSQDARKESRVTDAASSPDGRWVVLRTSDALLFYTLADLTAGKPTPPLRFDVRGLKEPQGEGVTWLNASTIYLAGEGAKGGTLSRVSCKLPGS